MQEPINSQLSSICERWDIKCHLSYENRFRIMKSQINSEGKLYSKIDNGFFRNYNI